MPLNTRVKWIEVLILHQGPYVFVDVVGNHAYLILWTWEWIYIYMHYILYD